MSCVFTNLNLTSSFHSFNPQQLYVVMPPRLSSVSCSRVLQCLSTPSIPIHFNRQYSSQTQPSQSQPSPPPTKPNNSRFLSTVKSRIGKCILFGLSTPQTQKAGTVLKVLGEEWRELVAGREGFLCAPKRAGLSRQKVVWGEMDCMVSFASLWTWYARGIGDI